MHELSIAISLVELASQAAQHAGVSHVTALQLRLGALSGVVCEALEFAFEIAANNTVVAGAKLQIELVSVQIYCPTCAKVVSVDSIQSLRCPHCQTASAQIIHGRELDLVALEYNSQEEIYASTTTA